ncbi:hypothetical protein F4W70_24760 [Pseudomonas cannabina]|nr:hypothetical protein F4W70_24760 [Pseudomonas cannabina]
MEDLTQDVRHVRKKCDPRQWETIFQSKWVSRVDRFSKKFPVGKSHSIDTPDSRPVCRLSLSEPFTVVVAILAEEVGFDRPHQTLG